MKVWEFPEKGWLIAEGCMGQVIVPEQVPFVLDDAEKKKKEEAAECGCGEGDILCTVFRDPEIKPDEQSHGNAVSDGQRPSCRA